MNQKQLEYFLKVYEAGSITRAAEQLYLSPQGLSKTILALEREMGVRLFDRAGRQMRPTAAAVWLRERARRLRKNNIGGRSLAKPSDYFILTALWII